MAPVDYEALFAAHHEHLWGLCYRMTGSTADAEDLVQETFERALTKPPPDTTRPWRPWLTRVATRLAIDALRRRQTRRYVGPWLPAPLPTPPGHAPGELASPEADAEARYDLRESASYAFLRALEALTPVQRATLVLRDALGYSGPETAALLEVSADHARVLLHRARKALARYDARRRPPSPEVDAQHLEALRRFMSALATGDAATIAACLTEEVEVTSDGAGRYRAALKPVRGRDRVARFFAGLVRRGGVPSKIEPCWVNARPALLAHTEAKHLRDAPRVLTTIDVDAHGQITDIHVVSAPDKLGALPGA